MNKYTVTILKPFRRFYRDVRTSEIKLELNNAAGCRLKRNKILFYVRRRPHILK